jgi:hypothetical protein
MSDTDAFEVNSLIDALADAWNKTIWTPTAVL